MIGKPNERKEFYHCIARKVKIGDLKCKQESYHVK